MVIAAFPAVRTELDISITPISTYVNREQIKIDASKIPKELTLVNITVLKRVGNDIASLIRVL